MSPIIPFHTKQPWLNIETELLVEIHDYHDYYNVLGSPYYI